MAFLYFLLGAPAPRAAGVVGDLVQLVTHLRKDKRTWTKNMKKAVVCILAAAALAGCGGKLTPEERELEALKREGQALEREGQAKEREAEAEEQKARAKTIPLWKEAREAYLKDFLPICSASIPKPAVLEQKCAEAKHVADVDMDGALMILRMTGGVPKGLEDPREEAK
jgi:hypothetical protein